MGMVVSRSRSLGERHPMIGPMLYLSSLQYFIIQVLVSLRWSPPYSLSRDTISDLGNTACARFNGRYVCSPLHELMNVSFILLGLTMIAGSILVGPVVARRRAGSLGFVWMAVGGIGVVVVGLFPENSVPLFHGIGATLPFLIGNAGVVLIGITAELAPVLRGVTLCAGLVSLAALVFYASGHYGGLGEGGIERIVAYPQTVWLILLGTHLSIMVKRRTSGSARS